MSSFTSISLPNGQGDLRLSPAVDGFALQPAFGGAVLSLTVDVAGPVGGGPVTAELSADLAAGVLPSQNLIRLCQVAGDRLVTAHPSGPELALCGFVAGAALAAVDEIRQGGAFYLVLRTVRARTLAGAPLRPIMEACGGDLHVKIVAEAWSAELERAATPPYFDLTMPPNDDPDLVGAIGHLRTARDSLREGPIGPGTAAEIRSALAAVCEAYGTKYGLSTIRGTKPRDRTVGQRWAVSVEDTYSLLSSFIHDDDDAVAEARLDRALATALLAEVAGKVGRLAADRRAGLV